MKLSVTSWKKFAQPIFSKKTTTKETTEPAKLEVSFLSSNNKPTSNITDELLHSRAAAKVTASLVARPKLDRRARELACFHAQI